MKLGSVVVGVCSLTAAGPCRWKPWPVFWNLPPHQPGGKCSTPKENHNHNHNFSRWKDVGVFRGSDPTLFTLPCACCFSGTVRTSASFTRVAAETNKTKNVKHPLESQLRPRLTELTRQHRQHRPLQRQRHQQQQQQQQVKSHKIREREREREKGLYYQPRLKQHISGPR